MSMQHQIFQLQKEVTPGTALINALRIYDGLRMTPGTGNEGATSYRGSGSRGTDTRIRGDDYGEHAVELTPDFNALLPVLASLFGEPVTTTPDATNAPTARQHVFTLMKRGTRTPVTYTAQWGLGSNAIQFAYFLFNTLTLGVQRSELTTETSGFSRDGDESVTLATTGVTTVESVPIDPTRYDVFSDNTWVALGTTKLLDCHEGSISLGETYGRSSPINSAIVSFRKALENEEVEYSGMMSLAFDAVSKALIATYKNGARKFNRLQTAGPLIGGAINYGLKLDYGYIITERGEVTTAPNSPEVVLPFNYELSGDPVSNKLIEVTLTNTVAAV